MFDTAFVTLALPPLQVMPPPIVTDGTPYDVIALYASFTFSTVVNVAVLTDVPDVPP